MFTGKGSVRCDKCGRFMKPEDIYEAKFYLTWNYQFEDADENYEHYHKECIKKEVTKENEKQV